MIPQPPLRVTDSFPQGSLGPYGAAGGHIGPPLPVYRGAKRRAVEDAGPYGGTTGSAMRWADVPKAWLPPTKFRAEIWSAVMVIGPDGRTGTRFPRRPIGPPQSDREVRLSL